MYQESVNARNQFRLQKDHLTTSNFCSGNLMTTDILNCGINSATAEESTDSLK